MVYFKYFSMLLLVCIFSVDSMQQAVQLPAMLLWKPLHEFHMTLFSFKSLEDVNKDRTGKGQFPMTANEYENSSKKRFEASNKKVLAEIKRTNDIAFPLTFPLLTLDILTPTKIFDGFVLNTSFKHPKGTSEKFYELMRSNPPSPEKGKHWYLVLRIGSEHTFDLTMFHRAYTEAYFKTPRRSQFLPHITVAEITTIADVEIFLRSIKKVNKSLKKLPLVSTHSTKNNLILKSASLEHPRPTVMLVTQTKNIQERVALIKNLFESMMKQQQKIKDEKAAQKAPEQVTLLSDALVDLEKQLVKLQLQLTLLS